MTTKNIIRENLKNLRDSLDESECETANSAICRSLEQLDEVRNAEIIAAYMPFDGEVDLGAFFAKCAENRKRVCFPRAKVSIADTVDYEMAEVSPDALRSTENNSSFSKGRYGIPEPVSECAAVEGKNIEVWLVPGIGFDLSGNRLGRGGGFYDRMLTGVSGIKIGIGYEIQLIEKIPVERNDQGMNIIVTEKKTLRIRK